MKKTAEIVNLPLICIDKGSEYGRIKGFLVNPESGKAEYFIIDDGQWYLGAKLLVFNLVLGIGKDAVTTEKKDNIIHISESKSAMDIASKGIQIIDTMVYTKLGQYVGKIVEYYIDEKDGRIIACEVTKDNEKNKAFIPASSIVTYGKDVLVVVEDVHNTMTESIGDRTLNNKDMVNQKIENSDNIKAETEKKMNSVEDNSKKDSETINKTDKDTNNQGLEDSIVNEGTLVKRLKSKENAKVAKQTANLFEKRQRDFLKGRKSSKTITDLNGVVIVEAGQSITDDIIDLAKDNGKLIELTMNTSS